MIERLVNRLENMPITFIQWIVTFACLVFLRTAFIETFIYYGDSYKIYLFGGIFIHYPLFFLVVVLSLMISLHLLTKEEIIKISKIIVFFSPIVLLPPIVDLIISRGKPISVNYIQNGSPGFLMKELLTYMNNLRGIVSLGLKIEIFIVCLLVSIYVWLKTKNYFKTAIAPFLVYFIIFFYGSLPAIIKILFPSIHFQYSDRDMSIVFLFLAIIQFPIWFYFYNKNKLYAALRNIRILRVMHYWVMFSIGYLLGLKVLSIQLTQYGCLSFVLGICSILFAWMFAVGINDIVDIDIDKISCRDRPLVKGILSLQEVKNLNLVYFIFSILFAYLVNYSFFVLILIYHCLSFIYSVPPLRLKRFLLISKLIIATASLSLMLGGFLTISSDQSLIQFPKEIMFFVLVCFTLGTNCIDVKDIEGDRAGGICTFLSLLGEKRGKKIVGFLVFCSYVLAPPILYRNELLPIAMLLGLISFLLINRKKWDERPVFMIYFIAIIGLIFYYSFGRY